MPQQHPLAHTKNNNTKKQIHTMRLGPAADFLACVLEPPAPRAVVSALEGLREVGALEPPPAPESLTPLGRHLAALPLEPRLGKLLVLGALLGCLSPALVRCVCLLARLLRNCVFVCCCCFAASPYTKAKPVRPSALLNTRIDGRRRDEPQAALFRAARQAQRLGAREARARRAAAQHGCRQKGGGRQRQRRRRDDRRRAAERPLAVGRRV